MAVPLGLVAASRGEQGGGHKARTEELSLITLQLCAGSASSRRAFARKTLVGIKSAGFPPCSPRRGLPRLRLASMSGAPPVPAAARVPSPVPAIIRRGRGDVALSAEGDAFLHELLLAHKTRSLGLPESTTFEPLHPIATNVPLGSDEYFSTHTVYQVPVDGELHVRPGQALGAGQPLVDIVHRFTVKRRTGAPLSDRLTAWAMHKERLGKEAEGRLGITPAGKGSDAGVQKTNVGGFQSFHDLFVEDSEEEESD